MERIYMSGSGKRTGNKSRQVSEELKNDVNLEKVRDISVKVNAQPEPEPEPEPQTSAQVLLSTVKRTSDSEQNDEWRKMVDSLMKIENERLKHLQKCQKVDIPEEVLIENHIENQLKSHDKENYQRVRSLRSNKEDFQDLQKRNSKVRMYNHGELNPERIIEIIQRELKTLSDISPSVITLATALSKTLSHYKECYRCSEKISSSLPRILNRIRKLTEYVKTKRHDAHLWPNYSYLRPTTSSGSVVKEPEEIKNSASIELRSDLLSKKGRKQIEELEKINVVDITEGRPGIQIPLRLECEIKKKRLFDKANHKFLENLLRSFPIVYLQEFDSVPFIQILKPSPKPQIFWDKRNTVLSPKELFYAYHQVFALPSIILISILVITPEDRINRIEKVKRELYFKPVKSCEKRILQTNKNSCRFLIPQDKKGSELKIIRSSCSQTQHSNEKKSESVLANASEMVQDLLKKAEEEKMRIHMMNELELEVKELKDLILEVYKNQMELGKVVVEEGIYSQPIMKLTNPNILEEENQIVKKLAEIEELGRQNSVENLQATVDYLKQKCRLKNRMIMNLVKCLRSSIHKKWWEEVINSAFGECESVEEFNPEKVTELLRQTSFVSADGKKASKEFLQDSRKEDYNLEEEPNTKEVMGANSPKILSHQEKKLVKTKGCVPISNFEGLLNCPSRMKILTFPSKYVPENMNPSVRKLESQISVLSMENERLWHEIHELKDQLKSSMKRLSSADSGQELPDKIKTTEKTISLTIQIAPEKDFRHLRQRQYPKMITNGETTDFSEALNSTPGVKFTVAKFVTHENETDSEKSSQGQNLSNLSLEFKSSSKSEKRRSENDLICNSPPTFSLVCGLENEKLKKLREKNTVKEPNISIQKLTVSTPQSSNRDIRQKPVLCVPSMHVIPEIIGSHQAGPSSRPAGFRCLPQSLSRIELTENQSLGMLASMANERELQTIPEQDHTNSNHSLNFSKDVSQAIQYLRTRVRSIHKDVTVLKSKNDRIDKMLDKLIDDAIDSNKNLDEVGNDLNNFKNRLG